MKESLTQSLLWISISFLGKNMGVPKKRGMCSAADGTFLLAHFNYD